MPLLFSYESSLSSTHHTCFPNILIYIHFRSPLTSGNVEMGTTQITSEYSSAMAGVIGDKDINLAGKKMEAF